MEPAIRTPAESYMKDRSSADSSLLRTAAGKILSLFVLSIFLKLEVNMNLSALLQLLYQLQEVRI